MQLALLVLLLQVPTLRLGTDTLEAANVVKGEAYRAGRYIRAVTRAGDQYLITATFESARGGTSYDTLALDARTLKPRWQRVHFATDSAAVRYAGDRVTGFSQRAGRPRQNIERVLPATARPSALVWHLVQTHGWPGTLTISEFDLWENVIKPVTYRSLRKEKMRHRGKQLDVWLIQEERGAVGSAPGARMVRLSWIDAARRRLVVRRDRPVTAGKNDGYLLVAR